MGWVLTPVFGGREDEFDTMEANELRIGNYIQRPDLASGSPRFEKVLELGDKITTTGPVKVICDYENIKPIPLTEQWLIDFGFSKLEVFWVLNGIYVEKIDNGFLVCIGEFEIFIDAVHNFQNLYFSIKGEELTIKEKV